MRPRPVARRGVVVVCATCVLRGASSEPCRVRHKSCRCSRAASFPASSRFVWRCARWKKYWGRAGIAGIASSCLAPTVISLCLLQDGAMEQKLRERLQQVKEKVRWGAEEAVAASGSPLASSASSSGSGASGRLVAHGPVSQVCAGALLVPPSAVCRACNARVPQGCACYRPW